MSDFFGYVTANSAMLSRSILEKHQEHNKRLPCFDFTIFERAFLGYRKDSTQSAQPVHDASKRYTLVFDGEIYNTAELAAILSTPEESTPDSPASLLLYGIISSGVSFLHHVNGEFAIALWDNSDNSLLLARDRFGIKPLYWTQTSEGVIFASNASDIACSGFTPSSIAPQSLGMFLSLSYLPTQASIFKDIKRLNAGEWLRFSPGHSVQQKKWWNLKDQWLTSLAQAPRKTTDWVDAFHTLLTDAIRIRTSSHLPIGAFLSGGLDSSVVTALLQRQHQQLPTFTMSFKDGSYNEAPAAAEIAQYLGTQHHEGVADIGVADCLQAIVSHLDEPLGDTSLIPMDTLCQFAKEHVGVALSGDGADELLAGYITNQADALYAKMLTVPAPLMRLIQSIIALLPDNRRKINFVFKLKQFIAAYPRDPGTAHACWRLLLYPEALHELMPSTKTAETVFAPFLQAWNEAQELPELDRFLYIDYKTWLEGDIVVKARYASSRHGLITRSPFYDHRLFALCAGMPTEMKRIGNKGKIVLRNVAQQLLPASILARPKRGFNAPVAEWLTHEWKEIAESTFTKKNLEDCGISFKIVDRMWSEHKMGKRNHGFFLFSLLIFLLWKKDKLSR